MDQRDVITLTAATKVTDIKLDLNKCSFDNVIEECWVITITCRDTICEILLSDSRHQTADLM